MTIDRESYIAAVIRALRAERDGAEVMDPGIAAYRNGDEWVFRYESRLSPTERELFWSWDAGSFGIHDRVADMSDALIKETAEGMFEIWKDELIDEITSLS